MEESYYKILGLEPGAGAEAISRAYRTLALKEHPDRFPPAERPRQHLRMMQVNEAYLVLRAEGRPEPETESEPGPPGETDYDYYKRGFHFLDQGRKLMGSHFSPRESRDILSDGEWDRLRLREALEALRYLQKAYVQFLKVLTFSQSPWLADSIKQLRYIEATNARYDRICEMVHTKT